jgi:hypothetical protein
MLVTSDRESPMDTLTPFGYVVLGALVLSKILLSVHTGVWHL